ncbi:chloride channel protein [Nocardioides terrisoli]|uniref:chloride channel protein n=1 Tax=Nocardioides terrisoli TaxID=3388267 RepID=UPI00287B76F5|nr:chloride channel protein [Nocardioides marmorisolisilvae]
MPTQMLAGRLQVRREVGRLLSGTSRAGYLRKWLLLGIIIGVIAGLGAALFITMLHAGTSWLLGTVGGYHVATTSGEGGVRAASGFARPWAVPLVTGGGALAAALLVYFFAPEAEGHGTDAAIAAVHANPKGLRGRVALVKMVSSALTIGSGGSGGREGPTAQISATFGSVLSRTLNLTPADSRIAVASGIASGIGAIFRAPLGGAVLGAELVFRDDLEVEALLPSIVSSVVAFAVFGSVTGSFSPIFGWQTSYHLANVQALLMFAIVGLGCGLMGRLYAAAFYRTSDSFERLHLPKWLKPALAGLVVGALGLAIPGVLGTGYGQIQQELSAHVLIGIPLWLVLVLPIAKIVATSLSIGSGGSGGIFGPGMVIGGATGAAVWRLLELGHAAPAGGPTPFVIVGMIACFGAIAHAPLAVMLMVAEMTGSLEMLAPAMVAIILALLVVGDATIYRSQLATRADSPARRFSAQMPPAPQVPVSDVMAPPRLVLPASLTASEALAALRDAEVPGAPVVDADGVFIGSLHAARLAEQVEAGTATKAGRLADAEALTLPEAASLDDAVDAVATSRGGWVPVLDVDMHVRGVVSTTDLVRGWRLAMRGAMRQLGRASGATTLVEETVDADSQADGARIDQLDWPPRAVLVAVHRRQGLAWPHPDTRLGAGDLVSVVCRKEEADAVRRLLVSQPTVIEASLSAR